MKRRSYYVDPKPIAAWYNPNNYLYCMCLSCLIDVFAGIFIKSGWVIFRGVSLFVFHCGFAFISYKFGAFDWMCRRIYKREYFKEFGRYPEL